MKNWVNFIGSQLLWMAAVGGASHGLAWLGPLVFVAFALLQLSPRFRSSHDATLMLLALPVGFIVDSTMAASGLLRYASPVPSPQLAPIWILALWMGFGLTFNHSLAYLMRRPAWAMALGAVVGPFSYWIASRGWGAVQFTDYLPYVLVPLSALWGAAMGLFSFVVVRLEKASFPPSAGASG